MQMRYLWRLDGELHEPRAERWASGIAIHLRYQPLTTVLVWREKELRRYLVLDGCPRCQPAGCSGICARSLFQQLLRTSLPGLTLTPVPRIVSGAREQQPIITVPTRTAYPLDSTFIQQWRAAMLITTWTQQGGNRSPIVVGARLSIPADGPSAAATLRATGWQRAPLATLLVRAYPSPPVPGSVAWHARASAALLATLHDPQQCLAVGVPTSREAA
jgi:hypothetical protein